MVKFSVYLNRHVFIMILQHADSEREEMILPKLPHLQIRQGNRNRETSPLILVLLKVTNICSLRIGSSTSFVKYHSETHIQSNLNGSNIFGTMEIHSRHG